ncbi:MAG: DUF1003 domain-containing protein [Flavobacteriia bacterium]|nr:DUF1003 domain-containing protein [Flavobacteriia bacterium]
MSNVDLPINQLILGSSIVQPIKEIIKKRYPVFTNESWIDLKIVHKLRKEYLENLVRNELGEIHTLEQEVVDAIQANEIITEKLNLEIEKNYTFGEKLSDKIAEFGGSWRFIISFLFFMFVWIVSNILFLTNKGFDPYPFILLNLILSCLAALQAPIIMMSQNRQEIKDRKRAENDYKTNLKAELEIRQLHDKIDHLISHQNKKIMEIQELQTDYLNELVNIHRSNKK